MKKEGENPEEVVIIIIHKITGEEENEDKQKENTENIDYIRKQRGEELGVMLENKEQKAPGTLNIMGIIQAL